MSNTLKLGNGQWATGKDTILAYNDLNSNYKPLAFSFSRASSATVVNKDGLIETVGSGEPRIDFKDNTKGALLLEPSRTNKVIYEDFTQWTNYNASAVLSEETIYGKNAYKIVEDSTLNNHGLYLTNLFTADGTNYIWSVYVKGGERRYVVLTGRAGISSNDSAVIFDTQDGVWTLDVSSQNQAFSAESVGNGWWRIAIEGNPTSGAYDSYTIAASLDGTTYTDANYQGDGTSGIYVAMAQLEEGSYATSYIPTSGQSGGVTRVAEVCKQDLSKVTNSNAHTFYIEGLIKNHYGVSDGHLFSFSSSDTNSSTAILMFRGANKIKFYGQNNGVPLFNSPLEESTTSDENIVDKYALTIENNRLSIYRNGNKIISSTSTQTIPTTLKWLQLNFWSNQVAFHTATYNDLRYYNTALTDQELAALTS